MSGTEQLPGSAAGPLELEFRDSIAILRLAPEGEKISILNEVRMRALESSLAGIRGRKELRGLVITGNSAGFCGGGAFLPFAFQADRISGVLYLK